MTRLSSTSRELKTVRALCMEKAILYLLGLEISVYLFKLIMKHVDKYNV